MSAESVREAARHGVEVAAHAHGSEGIAAAVRPGRGREYNRSVEGFFPSMTLSKPIAPDPDAHPRRQVTRALLGEIAERLKALADPTRLAILHALDPDGDPGERSVGDLGEVVGTSQANVSKHLGVLRHAGLVKARRDGMNVFYSVADPMAFDVCRIMCDMVERRAHRDLAAVSGTEATAGPGPRA